MGPKNMHTVILEHKLEIINKILVRLKLTSFVPRNNMTASSLIRSLKYFSYNHLNLTILPFFFIFPDITTV